VCAERLLERLHRVEQHVGRRQEPNAFSVMAMCVWTKYSMSNRLPSSAG